MTLHAPSPANETRLTPSLRISPQAIRQAQDETRKRADLEKQLQASASVARAAQSATQHAEFQSGGLNQNPEQPTQQPQAHKRPVSPHQQQQQLSQQQQQEMHKLKEKLAAASFRCEELTERNEALLRQLDLAKQASESRIRPYPVSHSLRARPAFRSTN